MTSKFVFPKPYPLATKHQQKKRQLAYYSGLPVQKEKSIYFYWYQYLRRSEKYRIACGNDGKGMKSLYADFGDVFTTTFWDWWFEIDENEIERGAKLFAISQTSAVKLIDKPCAKDRPEFPQKNDRFLVSISRMASKADIQMELNRLLSKELASRKNRPIILAPKYPPCSVKVDVASLAKCLRALDMKEQGKSAVAIAAVAQGMDETRDREYFDVHEKDHRSMARFKDSDGIELDIMGKKVKSNSSRIANMRSQPRTKSARNMYTRESKAYLISHSHRLLEKAKANIEGAERGLFPVPHKKPTYKIGKRVRT